MIQVKLTQSTRTGYHKATFKASVSSTSTARPVLMNQASTMTSQLPPPHWFKCAVSYTQCRRHAIQGSILDTEDHYGKTILLAFKLTESIVIFDKLKRSNFNILGLRTARLSKRAVSQIFDYEMSKSASNEALLYCVIMRRCCVEILDALTLPTIYRSSSVKCAKEQIPQLFAELLVLP